MKSFVRATLLALALHTLAMADASAQAGTPKLAYINSQVILEQAPGRANVEAQFDKEMEGLRRQVKQMDDSLSQLLAAYQKAEATLSPAAKTARQKEITTKRDEYEKRAQLLQLQAQQRQRELVGPVMQQINQIIDAIRKEEGYSMIFDAGSTGGAIVAADTTLDITSKVIARLKTAPAAPATTPTKTPTGPVSQPAGVTRPKNPGR
ncbi:MAG TPA: OmpH family outer membrane protein [Gemmatimonadaceae bacterium]|nr:OmpH family outer membrane protein [Gemmatimonadaceae bacterium]